MFIEVPYQELLRSHPEAVQEALASIRKSRSKHKNDVPESFTWGFQWVVLIEGSGTLADLFQQEQMEEAMSIDDQVADFARRCSVFVQLQKRHSRASSEKLQEVPAVILEPYRDRLQADQKEEARFAALPPVERQREIQALLDQCRKDPGFTAFEIDLSTTPLDRRT